MDLNATIKREISLGIFSIFKVGSKELVISHLQYADDTILLGEAIMDNCGLLRFFLGVLSWHQVLRCSYLRVVYLV